PPQALIRRLSAHRGEQNRPGQCDQERSAGGDQHNGCFTADGRHGTRRRATLHHHHVAWGKDRIADTLWTAQCLAQRVEGSRWLLDQANQHFAERQFLEGTRRRLRFVCLRVRCALGRRYWIGIRVIGQQFGHSVRSRNLRGLTSPSLLAEKGSGVEVKPSAPSHTKSASSAPVVRSSCSGGQTN